MFRRKSTQPLVPKWLRIVIPTLLIGAWLTAGAIGGPFFGKIEEVSENNFAAFLPESAEATKASEQLEKFNDDSTLPAIAVFTRNDNAALRDDELGAINDVAAEVAIITDVNGEISPAQVSENEKAALVFVPIASDTEGDEAVTKLREVYREATPENVSVSVTGPAAFSADLTKAFGGIDGILLLTALSVVFVILLIVYRSVILPVIVLLTSVFALSAAIIAIYYLARAGVFDINGQVQGILFILVIGAATDYSLLYVARYREELYQHKQKLTATFNAWKGTIEPIAASGGTVIVGLLFLLLSDLGSNQALAPVGSFGIVFAMLSALTFLPAVLFSIGRASFWPVIPSADKKSAKVHAAQQKSGIWQKIGGFVAARPRAIWVVTVLVLGLSVLGVTQLRADGVPQSEIYANQSEAKDGQKLLEKNFPAGSGSPAQIVVDADKIAAVTMVLDETTGVEGVVAQSNDTDSGIVPLGNEAEKIRADIRSEVKKERQNQIDEQVASVSKQAGPQAAAQAKKQISAAIPSVDELVEKAYPFSDAEPTVIEKQAVLQATLSDASDSDAAKATVERIRAVIDQADESALVGGTTAIQVDTIDASQRDQRIIIPLVLVAITLILMALLRSVVAPLLLMATTVLSFGATLGIAALLFNYVFGFPGAEPSVILYGFVFLVALGIDYNIFLMTRVREEALKNGTQKGVIDGLVVTGGVITSAGVVLAATFAALGVIPILFLYQIAFIVAFGVLLDTIVVRSLLVPALIKDIGSAVWWPSKLKDKK